MERNTQKLAETSIYVEDMFDKHNIISNDQTGLTWETVILMIAQSKAIPLQLQQIMVLQNLIFQCDAVDLRENMHHWW